MWCTSKDWKTGYFLKNEPTEKFLWNKGNTHKQSTIKDKK